MQEHLTQVLLHHKKPPLILIQEHSMRAPLQTIQVLLIRVMQVLLY